MPKAGIDWAMDDPIWAFAKIIATFARAEFGPKGGGWFKEKGKGAEERLLPLMPWLIDRFKKEWTGKGEFAEAIAWRARAGFEGEIARFRKEPRYARLVTIAERTLATNTTVTIDQIYEANEEQLLELAEGAMGLYVRQDPELPNRIYVGVTSNLTKRNSGHNNANHRLVHFIPALDNAAMRQFESAVIKLLSSMDECLSENSKGLLTFRDGVNAFKLFKKVLCNPTIIHFQKVLNPKLPKMDLAAEYGPIIHRGEGR